LCRNLRYEKLARACQSWPITLMVNVWWQTDVFFRPRLSQNKNSGCWHQGSQSLPFCFPFLQSLLKFLFLSAGNWRFCFLLVCLFLPLFSIWPFLCTCCVCAVFVYFCDFFNSIRLTYGRYFIYAILLTTDRPSKILKITKRASTQCLLSARVPISPLLLSLSQKGPQQLLSFLR
jgi:hypothetical protein